MAMMGVVLVGEVVVLLFVFAALWKWRLSSLPFPPFLKPH